MTWSPQVGARMAVHRLGQGEVIRHLCALVAGDVPTSEMVEDPWNTLIVDIAGTHPVWVLQSERREYWPRAWAARALCYVGDERATVPLIRASRDEHWRVRMNTVRALGIVGGPGSGTAVRRACQDSHPRVRAAAATALGSIGGDGAFNALTRLAIDPDWRVVSRAETALERLARSD